MNRSRVIAGTVLLILGFGFTSSHFPQESASPPAKRVDERRVLAISFLRTINTGELTYKYKHESYGTWQNLLSDQSGYFENFLLSRNGGTNPRFGDAPEILPGWNLRLNVHADGQGYDVLLEDKTDREHGYAALSDERGAIRECRWLE